MKINAYKSTGQKYKITIKVIDRDARPFLRVNGTDYGVRFSYRKESQSVIPCIIIDNQDAQKALGVMKYRVHLAMRCDPYKEAIGKAKEISFQRELKASGKVSFFYRHQDCGFELIAVKNDFIIKLKSYHLFDDNSDKGEQFEDETMKLVGCPQYNGHAPLMPISVERINELLETIKAYGIAGYLGSNEFLPETSTFNRTYKPVYKMSHYNNIVKKTK